MNRMSVSKVYAALAPVLRSVPVPVRLRSASAMKPLKSKINDGLRPLGWAPSGSPGVAVAPGLFPPCAAHPFPPDTTTRSSGDRRRLTRGHTPAYSGYPHHIGFLVVRDNPLASA